MLLMIDNYDSFTYNIVHYFQELGAEVEVIRNDQWSIERIEQANPSHIVISPGPCTPNEAGISMEVIQHFSGKKPLLGVCLGHQSLGQVFGGKVVRAKKVMHGKTSEVYHNDQGVFSKLKNPLVVTRYHSLVVAPESLPDCLQVSAWTQDSEGNPEVIMGLRHKHFEVEGVQFHPESIMTEQGHALLKNFLDKKSAIRE